MEIRVSVANLVPRLIAAETGNVHFIGLLNRKLLKRGERVYGAIGGAAELTENGIDLLHTRFGARFEKGRDARFFIQTGDLDAVMKLFEARNQDFCEVDPSREIREELTMLELPDMPRVLTPDEAERIKIRFIKSMYQAEDPAARTSTKAEEILSRRYFHLFEMVVTTSLFERLRNHPAIKLFTEADLATTQLGLVRGTAQDGSMIATNLFW